MTNYTYNANNWLTGKTNKKTDNTVLSQYTYSHYRDGNIYQENAGFKKEDNSWQTQNRTYNYDPQGRLVQVTEGSSVTSYTYDLRGNRVTKASGADTTSYTYDLNNRLLSEAEGDTTTLYEYDDRGNLVSKRKETLTDEAVTTDSASVLTDNLSENVELYTYNGFNQLSEYRTGGTKASYTYNAEGIRASKTVNGATTQFLLDGANVIGEVNANSQVTHYIRGVSGIIYSVDGSYAQSTKKYYTTNGHGDVVGLLNNTGTLTKSYTYDPFGVEQNIDTNDTNPFRYCGEYFDNENRTIYLRNRYYSAVTGRFTQQDPLSDGMNWYNYCGGNPITHVDPLGLKYIPLRQVIEGLDGNVYWENNQAIVHLDGEIATFYEGDGDGTYIENGIMYVDDAFLFAALRQYIDLGKGWKAYIERDTHEPLYNRHHAVIERDGQVYAQRDDGGPHDKKRTKGSPPKYPKDKLKELKGWDWDKKQQSFLDNTKKIMIDNGTVIITYPDGKKVTIIPGSTYAITSIPSDEEIIDLYLGEDIVFTGSGGEIYIPLPPGPVPLPLPQPYPIPALKRRG